MDPNLEYSWASSQDQNEIFAFLEMTYGQDSIQAYPGRCRWLYFENPLGLHISICRADGKIIAVCGHLPQMVRFSDEMILAGFGIDFMVAKNWRRRGIGRKFLEMRLDRFALSLSLGQSREMGALYRSLEAVDLGPLNLGIYRKRPSFSGGLKALVRNNLAWSKGLGGARAPSGWVWEACDVTQAASFTTHPNWFAWRYGSRPYNDYSFWSVKTGQTRSIVVSRNTGNHVLIVDLHGDEKYRAAILAGATDLGLNVETRILFTGNRMNEECVKAGFWVRPQMTTVIAMTSDLGLRNRLHRGVVDIAAGSADADLLRIPSGS